jgi:hypothetical protein
MITVEGLKEEIGAIVSFIYRKNNIRAIISWYDFCRTYRNPDHSSTGKQSIENIVALIESLTKPIPSVVLVDRVLLLNTLKNVTDEVNKTFSMLKDALSNTEVKEKGE